jgi:hypothetical protein
MHSFILGYILRKVGLDACILVSTRCCSGAIFFIVLMIRNGAGVPYVYCFTSWFLATRPVSSVAIPTWFVVALFIVYTVKWFYLPDVDILKYLLARWPIISGTLPNNNETLFE